MPISESMVLVEQAAKAAAMSRRGGVGALAAGGGFRMSLSTATNCANSAAIPVFSSVAATSTSNIRLGEQNPVSDSQYSKPSALLTRIHIPPGGPPSLPLHSGGKALGEGGPPPKPPPKLVHHQQGSISSANTGGMLFCYHHDHHHCRQQKRGGHHNQSSNNTVLHQRHTTGISDDNNELQQHRRYRYYPYAENNDDGSSVGGDGGNNDEDNGDMLLRGQKMPPKQMGTSWDCDHMEHYIDDDDDCNENGNFVCCDVDNEKEGAGSDDRYARASLLLLLRGRRGPTTTTNTTTAAGSSFSTASILPVRNAPAPPPPQSATAADIHHHRHHSQRQHQQSLVESEEDEEEEEGRNAGGSRGIASGGINFSMESSSASFSSSGMVAAVPSPTAPFPTATETTPMGRMTIGQGPPQPPAMPQHRHSAGYQHVPNHDIKQTQNRHQNHMMPAPPSLSSGTSFDPFSNQRHFYNSKGNCSHNQISPAPSPYRLRNNPPDGRPDPATVIQHYIEMLSLDESTVFGATLHRFIECTCQSKEQDPYVVIRRVRQFLNGMKNYLVKNGEAELHRIIERESERLNINEFLNIDAIFEAVLTKILLTRIKRQLYRLMVLETTRNGELAKLSEHLSRIRSMRPTELGFPEHACLPDPTIMDKIGQQFRKMQNHYSPVKKLEQLLRILMFVLPPFQQQQQTLLETFAEGGEEGPTTDSSSTGTPTPTNPNPAAAIEMGVKNATATTDHHWQCQQDMGSSSNANASHQQKLHCQNSTNTTTTTTANNNNNTTSMPLMSPLSFAVHSPGSMIIGSVPPPTVFDDGNVAAAASTPTATNNTTVFVADGAAGSAAVTPLRPPHPSAPPPEDSFVTTGALPLATSSPAAPLVLLQSGTSTIIPNPWSSAGINASADNNPQKAKDHSQMAAINSDDSAPTDCNAPPPLVASSECQCCYCNNQRWKQMSDGSKQQQIDPKKASQLSDWSLSSDAGPAAPSTATTTPDGGGSINKGVMMYPAPSQNYHYHQQYHNQQQQFGHHHQSGLLLPPAEELIRWLVFLLAKTSFINCEVEAWYIWELLPQQVLTTGNTVYYLSTLFSAIHIIKHPDSIRRFRNLPYNNTAGNSQQQQQPLLTQSASMPSSTSQQTSHQHQQGPNTGTTNNKQQNPQRNQEQEGGNEEEGQKQQEQSRRYLMMLSTKTSAEGTGVTGTTTNRAVVGSRASADQTSDAFLRVAVPNEQYGTIDYHTFPVLPKMNAAKLCRVIAHQFSITNPEDFGLYVLYDGFETCLSPGDFPHLIRDQLCNAGKPHLFAYKRTEARIAWPKQACLLSAGSASGSSTAPVTASSSSPGSH